MIYLDYPDELHDHHADYPLAPERMVIEPCMLSPKQLEYLGVDTIEDIKSSKVTKLVPNLYPKKKYIVYYRNLKLYLKHGMELKKVKIC